MKELTEKKRRYHVTVEWQDFDRKYPPNSMELFIEAEDALGAMKIAKYEGIKKLQNEYPEECYRVRITGARIAD